MELILISLNIFFFLIEPKLPQHFSCQKNLLFYSEIVKIVQFTWTKTAIKNA